MKTREIGRVEHQRRFRRGFGRPSQDRNHIELLEGSYAEYLKPVTGRISIIGFLVSLECGLLNLA